MFEALKNMFRKGGVALGMVNELTNITDHPKISVSNKDYERIQRDLRYFNGNFPKIREKNSNHNLIERDYITLNMAQVISKRMASLVFNEKAKINVTDDSAKKFIDDVLLNNDFEKNFETRLESMFALGGMAIRPYYDKEHKQIKLSWAQAPSIFPLRSNTNNISDIAIASVTQRVEGKKTYYYTLLEFHEWKDENNYTITNELYKSDDSSKVGTKIQLSELYPDLAEQTEMNGFSRPIVTYIKPAGFNNQNITSPVGLGIYSNSLGTLEAINDTYDELHTEVLLGRRRIVVSEQLTQLYSNRQDNKPDNIFDTNERVFISLPSDPDKPMIQDLTSPIRTDYINIINNYIRTLEMKIGFSSGTFSFDGAQGIKTATEIVSENSMTYQTRNSQVNQVERGIQELIVSICELAKSVGLFSGKIPEFKDITVDFDDGVFTDKNAQAQYWIGLISAGLAPKYKALEAIYDLSEDEAIKLADEIDGNTVDETDDNDSNEQANDEANGDE